MVFRGAEGKATESLTSGKNRPCPQGCNIKQGWLGSHSCQLFIADLSEMKFAYFTQRQQILPHTPRTKDQLFIAGPDACRGVRLHIHELDSEPHAKEFRKMHDHLQ